MNFRIYWKCSLQNANEKSGACAMFAGNMRNRFVKAINISRENISIL